MKLALLISFILLCSCNFSYKFTTGDKEQKKEIPVNVKIVKTQNGYEYYTNEILVNEFTEQNCNKEEMELLDYIYKSSLEENQSIPKEQRTKPKQKIVTELLK